MAYPPDRNSLKTGVYYLRYRPETPGSEVLFYEGTLRIAEEARPKGELEPKEPPHLEPLNRIATADLYARLREFAYGRRYGRNPCWWEGLAKRPCPEHLPPLESGVIPVFPREDYLGFLESTAITDGCPEGVITPKGGSSDRVTLRFRVYRFAHDVARLDYGGTRIAVLRELGKEAKEDYPCGQPVPCWAGPVLDEGNGQVVGQLELFTLKKLPYGHRVTVLRQATVKCYTVDAGIKLLQKEDIRAAFQGKADDPHWGLTIDNASSDLRGDSELRNIMKEGELKAAAEGEAVGREWTVGELHHILTVAVNADKKKAEEEVTKLAAVSDGTKGSRPDCLTACLRPLDPLDQEWIYRLLFVNEIEDYDRGVMFDIYDTDANNVPREGAAIEAGWRFPREELWGTEQDKKLFDSLSAYLRVTIHELGHAMGLPHHHEGPYFMNTTDVIAEDGLLEFWRLAKQARLNRVLETSAAPAAPAAAAGAAGAAGGTVDPEVEKHLDGRFRELATASQKALLDARFAANLENEFHALEVNRLRFWPDAVVRPGGAYEGHHPVFSDSEYEVPQGMVLELVPLLEALPLGAPVRFLVRIRNVSERTQPAPAGLGLSSGHVSGEVRDPSGRTRTYSTVHKALDSNLVKGLPPGRTLLEGLTLTRGALGALFPMAGVHQVRVHVEWTFRGHQYRLDTETSVVITPPADDAHRAIAFHILATPEVHPAIDVVGDHFELGNAAINGGLANPILSHHYRAIEARRLVTRHFGRQADYDKANGQLGAPVVLGVGDIRCLLRRVYHVSDMNAVEITGRMIQAAQTLLDRGQIDAWEHDWLTDPAADWRAGGAVGAKSLIPFDISY